MPPSRRPEEPRENINSISDNTPSAYSSSRDSGRELLESLRALRDSLAIRVNQISATVERLRVQAQQLERSFGEESGISGPSGASEQLTNLLVVREPYPTSVMPTGSPPPPQTHTTTSAIASEVNQLDRPITSAEIFRLLERASVTLADTPNHFTPDMEHTLEGLREVQSSLQGNVRELAEMGETRSMLRQTMRTRWERVAHQASESEHRGVSRSGESPQQESVRRLAEIAKEAENRRAGRKASSGQSTRGKRRGLPPTNTPTTTPILVQSIAVPRQPSPRPTRRRFSVPPTLSPPTEPTFSSNTRNSLSQLDTPSLDALHTQIAELDLNLEPAEYMSGLSTIIRQAIDPRPDPNAEDEEATELRVAQSPIESLLIRTSSPTLFIASESSLDTVAATVNNNLRDTGLTYRGRDVRDRIQAALPAHNLAGNSAEESPMGQTIDERVAAMLEVGRSLEHQEESGPTREALQASVLASHRSRLEQLRQQQLQSAREAARDPMRSVHEAAQSARELVSAATVITENLANQRARQERDIAYEASVQAELREAQAARDRAYNLYQRVVSARARHRSLPSSPRAAAAMARSISGQGRPEGTVVTVVPVVDVESVHRDIVAEDASRQMFQAAQMREAAIQQRLNWARSRLRRDTNGPDGLGPAGTEPEQILAPQMRQDSDRGSRSTAQIRVPAREDESQSLGPFSPRSYREVIGVANAAVADRRNLQGTVPNVEEAAGRINPFSPRQHRDSPGMAFRRTLGPRNERPEEVDTMVRIRHLQEPTSPTYSTTSSARAARRRRLRQLRLEVESNAGRADEHQVERGEGLQRNIADQVTHARRERYAALEDTNWAVTPSSPITARGNGDFAHIQISVGTTSTASEQEMRDWLGDGDEAVHRIVQHVLDESNDGGESSGESGSAGGIITEGVEGGNRAQAVSSSSKGLSNHDETASIGSNKDTGGSRTNVWPSGRVKRRERVYISLLDL